GPKVDEARAGQRLLAQLVRVAKQLVAAAHGEDHAATSSHLVKGLSLVLCQVKRTQALVAVLSAAHVEKVGTVRIEPVAEAACAQPKPDAPPAAAALEEQQVAAIGIDVH